MAAAGMSKSNTRDGLLPIHFVVERGWLSLAVESVA
jgi:hypothetical protein